MPCSAVLQESGLPLQHLPGVECKSLQKTRHAFCKISMYVNGACMASAIKLPREKGFSLSSARATRGSLGRMGLGWPDSVRPAASGRMRRVCRSLRAACCLLAHFSAAAALIRRVPDAQADRAWHAQDFLKQIIQRSVPSWRVSVHVQTRCCMAARRARQPGVKSQNRRA